MNQSTAEIINAEIVDEARDIMGDKFNDLLKRFILDTTELLSTIELSRASNDFQAVRDAAHTMKSSSYQMGAMQMHHQSATIESFLNERAPLNTIKEESTLDQMIEELRLAFDRYQKNITSYL